jgi:hypothetical protein
MRKPEAGTVALIAAALLGLLFAWFLLTRP